MHVLRSYKAMIVLGEVQSPPLHYGMLHIELAVIHILCASRCRGSSNGGAWPIDWVPSINLEARLFWNKAKRHRAQL